MSAGFIAVNVNDKLIHAIQKCIEQSGFYRNPTEFVTVAVREKIDEDTQKTDRWTEARCFLIKKGTDKG